MVSSAEIQVAAGAAGDHHDLHMYVRFRTENQSSAGVINPGFSWSCIDRQQCKQWTVLIFDPVYITDSLIQSRQATAVVPGAVRGRIEGRL